MNRLLTLFIFLLAGHIAQAQTGYLFVKKGLKKKRTYTEGDRIVMRLGGDTIAAGLITHLRDDTIFLNGHPIPRASVKAVVIKTKKSKSFHIPVNQLLLITGGVALTTGGLTLSKQASFKKALTAGLVIGYGPILINYIASKLSFGRKELRMGRKFRLQMIDFHLPRKRAF